MQSIERTAAPVTTNTHIASHLRPHVALVGFMGAGKTSIGRLLAEALGAAFVDLDHVIEESAGKSIAAIFRENGEVAFRARERAALRDVLARAEPMILATGGGTFIDPASQKLLCQHARTVYLKASAETLARRLIESAETAQRPLLKGPDPTGTIVRLLGEREESYAKCEIVVQTDAFSVGEVVPHLVRVLRHNTPVEGRSGQVALRHTGPLLNVKTSTGAYPIEMRAESGPWIADALCAVAPGERVGLITDSNVGPLHAAALVHALKARGKIVTVHTVKAGEGSKSLECVGELYDALLGAEIGREDALLALGGGVVGDLTGFVASTLVRGIRFVQVPTTTLAAVDSSVGGKTGINTRRGKNLVGTFYPPAAVLLAGSHLVTLPKHEHVGGLVEALKMAACLDAELFDDIVKGARALVSQEMDALLPTIARAVALKADIVQRDEREGGVRAVLNFGHTIGHAFESAAHFQMQHGLAVALGMVAEAQWAHATGRAGADVANRLIEALRALSADTDWRGVAIDYEALNLDKKRVGKQVRMPIVEKLGTFKLDSVPMHEVVEFLQRSTP